MNLLTPLITIFIIILLGILCYKKKLFNKTQIDGFELLLFKIIMPSYLFVMTYNSNLSNLLHNQYIEAYLITFGILAIITIAFFINKVSNIAMCIRILASSYVNAAIYTLPIITILLKNPMSAIIGNIIQVILIQPIFILLLNLLSPNKTSFTKKIINIITTPLIIMPLMGVLFNYLQIILPYFIIDAISLIGTGASCLALFVFGLTLGATSITSNCLKFDLLSMVIIKNLIHPIVAIIIGYFMALENYWFNSLIIAASSPTAFVVYLISKQFSVEERLIKKVIALSSIVATLSLILIAIIISK